MAAIIMHGSPGSYKSARIVQKYLVPALEQGRIVVTNLEGCSTLETIQKRLGKKFPDTARLVRIYSIGTDTAKRAEMWRHWYCWLPLGSMCIIDEAQDIYTNTKEWSESNTAYKPISYFSDLLPPEILELHEQQLAKFTVTEFDEADSDDTGETMFDDNGNVHYPVSLNSAFKRHRKYNWDLVFGTPDINDISKIIRGACEWAFHHRNRDSFIFTRRNPLVSQHKPMNNGLTVDKHFKKGAKVPLWVHLVYKSTQTGENTKSGQDDSPLKQPKILFAMALVTVSIFFLVKSVYDIFFADTSKIAKAPEPDTKAVELPAKNVPKVDTKIIKDTNPLSSRYVLLKNAATGNNNLTMLPFGAQELWLSGYAHPSMYIFTLVIKGEQHQINSDDLSALGYTFKLERHGLVHVKSNFSDDAFFAVFDPRAKAEKFEEIEQEQEFAHSQQVDMQEASGLVSAFSG